MALKALIFDFDGTIVDTESSAYDSWCNILGRYGVTLPLHLWQQCVGASYAAFHPVRYLNEQTGADHDLDEFVRLKDEHKSRLSDLQPLMPGVLALIDAAEQRRCKLAVASSSSYEWVDHHLQRTGIRERFPCVVTKTDVREVKPHPDIFLTTADRLGVDPGSCLVLEDSLNGVKAAKAAGMHCIAVPGPITDSQDFSGADHRVASLQDVNLDHFLRR